MLASAAERRLTLDVFEESLQEQAPFIDRLLVKEELTGYVSASRVLLSGVVGAELLQKLNELADQQAGVSFVDSAATISKLLLEYRQRISLWLVVAYVLIGCFLAFFFRSWSVYIIAAPALATLASLGLLLLLGQPITLFHMLAAVLVLGIGLDMGIFLRESVGAAHAILAITASSLTTMLAFGLLALSETPVLHYFGQMILLGILFSWLLAMTFNVSDVAKGEIDGL
jgi:predicted exporter